MKKYQTQNSEKKTSGIHLETLSNISYYLNRTLDPVEVALLFEDSGINRPTGEFKRISKMLDNSNLILSAWQQTKLVGIARSLTDTSYCCYLSDLAVSKIHQNSGIGKEIFQKVVDV